MLNSARRHVIPYTAVSVSTTSLTLRPSFASISLHSSIHFSHRFHSISLALYVHFQLSFFLLFYYCIIYFMNSIHFSFVLSFLTSLGIYSFFFNLLCLHFLPRILPSFYSPSVLLHLSLHSLSK